MCELKERGLLHDSIFGPMEGQGSKNITWKASLEQKMQEVEALRREELFVHTPDDCSEGCRRRGCGQVAMRKF